MKCLRFNVCRSQFQKKRTAVQSGGNGYDREGVEKRKIAAGNRKDGPDAVDDENAPAGIKE